MEVLTKLIVVIILQYIRISTHQFVHFKLTLYVNHISIKLEKINIKNKEQTQKTQLEPRGYFKKKEMQIFRLHPRPTELENL